MPNTQRALLHCYTIQAHYAICMHGVGDPTQSNSPESLSIVVDKAGRIATIVALEVQVVANSFGIQVN